MANPGSPVRDGVELSRRMQSFLTDEARGGPEIADLIGHLGQVGEVAIFGGMPRDIARGGAAAFASDVDLVVHASAERLAELMRDGAAVRNRFGGYRIAGRRHSYDVWALPSTWAVRSGHVQASHLADLVRTTFFDCDAVLYLCGSRQVHHGPRFTAWLRDGVVDINLEENPNPNGVVARALRIILEHEQIISPRLGEYLRRMAGGSANQVDGAGASRLSSVLAGLRPLPSGAGVKKSARRPASSPACHEQEGS
jgi:predicted nucleotidyltransferase